jgi:hypothetical protein
VISRVLPRSRLFPQLLRSHSPRPQIQAQENPFNKRDNQEERVEGTSFYFSKMKRGNAVRYIQVNLHRANVAAAILQRRFIQQNMGVAFLQEPWTYKDRVAGLTSKHGKLIYHIGSERPRAAFMLNLKISYFLLTNFISSISNYRHPNQKGNSGEHCGLGLFFLGGTAATTPGASCLGQGWSEE